MASNVTGSWSAVQDWPLIGLHAVVTQDGKVLTFGTDNRGMQSGQFIYDVYDPVNGTHTTLDNKTITDIFCSAAIIIPGTNQVLIGGGDARPDGAVNAGVNHANIFSNNDLSLIPSDTGVMEYARWYPTMVSLATGQIVIMGGSDGNHLGVGIPEIFTPGEGWRALSGASDADVATSSYYPRAWVNGDGEVIYFATGNGDDNTIEVMALNPSGEGSLRQIATLPFHTDWESPAIMYEAGKVLIQADTGQLWTMDISGATPVFAPTGSPDQDRNWSNMTVLADGSVLINGGTSTGNLEAGADKTAAIWNPATGTITYGADEDAPRLYHSASVLLADGTLLSLGGGAAMIAENNYLDGQIYKPSYLFDDNGNEATRPVILEAPSEVVPGQQFTITVDNASAIEKLTFVKNGAATHTFNMEARMVHLDFQVGSDNTLNVTLPENANELTAGNWMLFAWNDQGVPSKAPILSVDPTLAIYDGIGDVRADYFIIDPTTSSLDQINFDGTAIHSEMVTTINQDTLGSFYEGGPSDDFAVRYSGQFAVARDGNHTFYLNSDDGSRLYIDGVLVINNDGLHAQELLTASVALTAGTHEIVMEYFERGGGSIVDLDWEGPGFARKQMHFDGAVRDIAEAESFNAYGATAFLKGSHFSLIAGNLDSSSGTELRIESGPAAIRFIDDDASMNGDSVANEHADDSMQFVEINGKNYRFAVDHKITFSDQSGNLFVFAVLDVDTDRDGNFNRPALGDDSAPEDGQVLIQLSGPKPASGSRLSLVEGSQEPLSSIEYSDLVGLGWDPDTNIIQAGEQGGYLAGTDGNDEFRGAGGDDIFLGGKGDDTFIGAGGYNQIDYPGTAKDYTFSRNANGTISVSHAQNGIDTLTGIGGIWFLGEGRWYSINDLVTISNDDSVNVIEVGNEGGYLGGTSGNDEFRGGAGNDIFQGGRGDDVFLGAGGYNQINYSGVAADYTFLRNADGTISVSHPQNGTDTLSDIGGIWFTGESRWYPISELTADAPGGGVNIVEATPEGGYLGGTSGDDEFRGGAGNDVFQGGKGDDVFLGDGGYNQINYEGSAGDYSFTRNADGTVTVTHPQNGTDTLSDIGGLWFTGESKWYALSDLVVQTGEGGPNLFTAGNEGGYLKGTQGDDHFKGGAGRDTFYGGTGNDIFEGGGSEAYDQVDLDGVASDYTFTRNDDGSITVSSAEYGEDILTDIDGIWFTGDGTWSSVDDLVS